MPSFGTTRFLPTVSSCFPASLFSPTEVTLLADKLYISFYALFWFPGYPLESLCLLFTFSWQLKKCQICRVRAPNFDWFVLSMRMQVLLDSSFKRRGPTPLYGARKESSGTGLRGEPSTYKIRMYFKLGCYFIETDQNKFIK